MLSTAIRVKGQIDKHWSKSFADLTITHLEDGCSLLSGSIADQAALYGILSCLWDYRLELISVDVIAGSTDAESVG